MLRRKEHTFNIKNKNILEFSINGLVLREHLQETIDFPEETIGVFRFLPPIHWFSQGRGATRGQGTMVGDRVAADVSTAAAGGPSLQAASLQDPLVVVEGWMNRLRLFV